MTENVPNSIDGQIKISEYLIVNKPYAKMYFPADLKTSEAI
jgi:hypothetical protein